MSFQLVWNPSFNVGIYLKNNVYNDFRDFKRDSEQVGMTGWPQGDNMAPHTF